MKRKPMKFVASTAVVGTAPAAPISTSGFRPPPSADPGCTETRPPLLPSPTSPFPPRPALAMERYPVPPGKESRPQLSRPGYRLPGVDVDLHVIRSPVPGFQMRGVGAERTRAGRCSRPDDRRGKRAPTSVVVDEICHV